MKNLNLAFNLILSVAVIILFYLVLKKDSNGSKKEVPTEEKNITETPSEPLTISEKSASIVYVNSDSLFKHYQFFKDNQDASERERKALENSIQSRITTFQKEVEDFKEKAQYMTQEQGMAKQQELMEKEQKIADFRDVQSEQLLKKEQDRADSALARVTRFLDKNYSNTKYTYILGYSHGGGILFARDSLDITKEVIDGLNKEYKATKK